MIIYPAKVDSIQTADKPCPCPTAMVICYTPTRAADNDAARWRNVTCIDSYNAPVLTPRLSWRHRELWTEGHWLRLISALRCSHTSNNHIISSWDFIRHQQACRLHRVHNYGQIHVSINLGSLQSQLTIGYMQIINAPSDTLHTILQCRTVLAEAYAVIT